MLNSNFFKKNREAFKERLPNNSLTIVFSGREIPESLDQNFPFSFDHNFYYLTGLKEPEGILTFYKDSSGKTTERLFIPRADKLQEKWVGYRYSPITAGRISGITSINYIEAGQDYIDSLLEDKNIKLGLDRSQAPHQWYFADKLEPEGNEVFDFSEIIHSLRIIKQDEEIKALKEASHITNKGLNAILTEMHPGMYEYELSSLFDYIIRKNGSEGNSFPTIAASGPNGPILHYVTNQRKIARDDLILFDLGAKIDGYCADVSRTYPVSGKFTPLQKKFYTAVLDSQKDIIKEYKKGVKLQDLQKKVKELLEENLIKQGIKVPVEGIDKWYYHNIGHSLGLDAHDASSRDLVLEDGMIITCEPGLYAQEYGIGIRIEDDILINGDEPIVLTAEIPKEIKDISKLIS